MSEKPEGAVAVTAADVVSKAVPDRFEDVELWLLVSASGLRETITVRVERGEKAELQVSPLDGSILGLKFEFRDGTDKNERTGRQFFPVGPGLFSFSVAYHKMPIYKEGNSPAEVEYKRREQVRLDRIQERAAQLAAGLDPED